MSGDQAQSGDWLKYVGTGVATIGMMVTLHINFIVPSLHADMKDIAETEVARRLDQWERLRQEQIGEIRKSLDKMADRIDRIDAGVSEQLRSIASQIGNLTMKIERK